MMSRWNGSNFWTKKARRLGLVPKFAHRGGLEVTANEFYSKNFRNIFKSCLKLKNRCEFWHALFLTIFNSNLNFCFWFFSTFLCFVIQNIIWLYTAEEKIRLFFEQFSTLIFAKIEAFCIIIKMSQKLLFSRNLLKIFLIFSSAQCNYI